MADAPTPKKPSSLFSGNKRIPEDSFHAYLASAFAVDAIFGWWLPGTGVAFVACCNGLYWLNRYKTDKMGATTIIAAIIGVFPVLDMISNVAFVGVTYYINHRETKPIAGEKERFESSKTARMAAYGTSYVAGRAGIDLGKSKDEKAGTQGPSGEKPHAENPADKAGQSVSHEQKGTSKNTAIAPTNAADKNTVYHGRNVDGVTPATEPANNNSGHQGAA